MTPDDIRDKYLFIGNNRREENKDEFSSQKKRPIIGNKGIGKLAGFGVADTIQVISIKDGKKSQLTLEKKIFESFQTLSDCKINIQVDDTDEKSGTNLILSNLSDQVKPIDSNFITTASF